MAVQNLLRIKSDKSLYLYGGIDFSGVTGNTATYGTSTSNLLSDYEEGSWASTLHYYNNSQWNADINTQWTGYYTKIGNIVTVQMYTGNFTLSPTTGGYKCAWSLPFSINSVVEAIFTVGYTNNPFSTTDVVSALGISNSSLMHGLQSPTGNTAFWAGNTTVGDFFMSGSYRTT